MNCLYMYMYMYVYLHLYLYVYLCVHMCVFLCVSVWNLYREHRRSRRGAMREDNKLSNRTAPRRVSWANCSGDFTEVSAGVYLSRYNLQFVGPVYQPRPQPKLTF